MTCIDHTKLLLFFCILDVRQYMLCTYVLVKFSARDRKPDWEPVALIAMIQLPPTRLRLQNPKYKSSFSNQLAGSKHNFINSTIFRATISLSPTCSFSNWSPNTKLLVKWKLEIKRFSRQCTGVVWILHSARAWWITCCWSMTSHDFNHRYSPLNTISHPLEHHYSHYWPR